MPVTSGVSGVVSVNDVAPMFATEPLPVAVALACGFNRLSKRVLPATSEAAPVNGVPADVTDLKPKIELMALPFLSVTWFTFRTKSAASKSMLFCTVGTNVCKR